MSTTPPEIVYLFDIGPSVPKLHITGTYIWRPGHPAPMSFPALDEAVRYAVEQGWVIEPVPTESDDSQDFPHNWFQLTDARWKQVRALERRLAKTGR